MSISISCPDCDARLTLRAAPAAGARLRCPKCSTPFTYTASSDTGSPAAKKSSGSTAKKSAVSANPPPRRPRDLDQEDNSVRPRGRSAARSDEPDEDEEERRPRKKKKAKAGSNTGLIIGLAVGAGGLIVLGIVAVAVLFAMRETPGAVQAKGDLPGELVKDPLVPPQPVNDGKLNEPVPVAPPKKIDPAELYGDQGGEEVAAADPALPSTLMRARRDDTFYQLSNPREGQVKGPDSKGKGNNTVRDALIIDYVAVRRGKHDGGMLVIHTEDGRRSEVTLNLSGRDQGTIELVGVTNIGFGKRQLNSKTEFPKNVEFYVTRVDDRYRPQPKFLVSNSLVMGEMKIATRGRDWTPAEINNYGKAPPAYMMPNLHPTLGEDVPPLNGWTRKKRFVEPDGRLYGLEYHMSAWAGQPRIGSLVPIFSLDQPESKTTRELARPGYAVAGAEVNVDKAGITFGIRLMFRRVKPDNSLDAADAYAGEWIGTPPADAPKVLANDGRRVMGMSYQTGAVLDLFALVVAR